jgi:CHAD domain-containing protein
LLAAREAAYDAAVVRLRSADWAAMKSRLDQILAGPLWSGLGEPDVETAAAVALERRYQRVNRRGARLRELSPHKRHEVRIEAKKLRYGCEFFESVYAARWPVVETLEGPVSAPKAFSVAVEDIQSVLGRLNDHAAAAAYLTTVGVSLAELDVPALLDEADLAYERFAAMTPFWRE